MEKENVLKEALNETERDGKETVIKDGVEKNGSAVLGKFKDENALLSADGATEAYFAARPNGMQTAKMGSLVFSLPVKAEKPEKDGVGESGLNGVKTESVAITKEEFVEPANESLVGDERGEKESLENVVDGFALDGAKPVEAVAKVFGAGSVAQSVSDQEIYERAVLWGHYERGSEITLPGLAEYKGLPCGGYKYRMHQLSSVVGLEQLKKYDSECAVIDKAMKYFWEGLSDLPLGNHIPAEANSFKGGWYACKGLYNPDNFEGLSLKYFIDAIIAEGGQGFAAAVIAFEKVFGDLGVPFAVHVEEAEHVAAADETARTDVYKHSVFSFIDSCGSA